MRLNCVIIFITKKQFQEQIPPYHNFSSIRNSDPGASPLQMISFRGGFHGRSIGALACSRSIPQHKWSFPSFSQCPMMPFPRYQYPIDQHSEFNRLEDEECIQFFSNWLKVDSHQLSSCGVIVEPIQCEGGDNHASKFFFQQIRELCLKYDIPFVVDEVQTGLGTGKVYAHEHWEFKTPPDMVLFSKKFQA